MDSEQTAGGLSDEPDTHATMLGLLGDDDAPEPMQEAAESAPGEGADAEPGETPAIGEDEGQIEPEPAPAIVPPLSFSAEEKAEFAKLPPDLQRIVADRESERERQFHRRTIEAAERARSAEAERAAVAQERQRLAGELNQLITRLRVEHQQEPDWLNLARQLSPEEYNAHRAAWDQRERAIATAVQEQQRLFEQHQQDQRKAFEEFARAEAEKLVHAVPEWQDATKAASEKGDIARYLAGQYGYTPQELGSLVDHRAVIVARKAMLYDRLMAKKPETIKRVAEAPKMQKPGTVPSRGEKAAQQQAAKMQQLRKTGHIREAAAVMADFL